jgi:hypothetical protein
MRALLILLFTLGLFIPVYADDAGATNSAATHATAKPGKVLKVLSFWEDQEGQIATSPSLFDRDAYQAYLREHTNEVSALRFDVLWKATKAPAEQIKIALELRGVGIGSVPKLKTIEVAAPPGKHREWTEIPLAGDDFKNFGAIVAWRVTLWNGGRMLGEQKSFLW